RLEDRLLPQRLLARSRRIVLAADELQLGDVVLDGKIHDLVEGHPVAGPGLQSELHVARCPEGRKQGESKREKSQAQQGGFHGEENKAQTTDEHMSRIT